MQTVKDCDVHCVKAPYLEDRFAYNLWLYSLLHRGCAFGHVQDRTGEDKCGEAETVRGEVIAPTQSITVMLN